MTSCNKGNVALGKTLDSQWGNPLKMFEMFRKMRAEGTVFEGMDVA